MVLTPQRVEDIAESIAREFHDGQMYDDVGFHDAAGEWHEPRTYVDGHLLPAVRVVRALGYGPLYVATTWLHDGPEDTDMTLEYLKQRCLPAEVVFGVDCTTKRQVETPAEYRARLILSPHATVAKFGDSSVNLANTLLRQPVVPEQLFRKRVETYLGNLAFLRSYLPDLEAGTPRAAAS